MTPEQKQIISHLVLDDSEHQDRDEEEDKYVDKEEDKLCDDGDVFEGKVSPASVPVAPQAQSSVVKSKSYSGGILHEEELLAVEWPTVPSESVQPGAIAVAGVGASASVSASESQPPSDASQDATVEEEHHDDSQALDWQEPLEATLVVDGSKLSQDLEHLDIETATPSESFVSTTTTTESNEDKDSSYCTLVVFVAALALLLVGLVFGGVALLRPQEEDKITMVSEPLETPTEPPTILYPPLEVVQTLWSTTLRAVLEDPGSPQYKANAWLSQDPHLDTYPWWRKRQRFGMAVKYFSMGGPYWYRNDHWLSYKVHECSWYSSYPDRDAVCTEEGHLIIDDLHDNNLTGPIIRETFICPFGIYWDTSNNHLSGTIPPLTLTNILQVFKLNNNNLEGPIVAEAGFTADGLRVIDVSQNQFVGELPFYIFPSLEVLNVSHNLFGGQIPTQLDTMTSLQVLDLSHNLYSGTLPSELQYISTLQELDVSGNDMSGSIPTDLCTRTSLNIAADCNLLDCC